MPVICTASTAPGVRLELHASGIPASPMPADADGHERLPLQTAGTAALAGQAFGHPYFDSLPRARSRWTDPLPATAAILAAETLAGRGVDMLSRIQRAHHLEGRAPDDLATLRPLAADLQLPADAFAASLESWSGTASLDHIRSSRHWMKRFGITRLPALLIEDDGAWQQIPIQRYVGRPALWREVLETVTA